MLCFDGDFAKAQGWPVLVLDLLLMALVVLVTVIGLQAVGLLLVVALLIIPAAAARFWTDRLSVMVLLAGLIGAASGFVGVAASAVVPKLPAGAVIVLSALALFAFSMLFGGKRGVFVKRLEQFQVTRRVRRQHLLRALYEWCEKKGGAHAHLLDRPVPTAELRGFGNWNERDLAALLKLGAREDLVHWVPGSASCQLTGKGKLEARRVTRNHRLWETYLLNYADVAPQHIHHNADQIEHVIEPEIVNHLEELLAGGQNAALVPTNPEP